MVAGRPWRRMLLCLAVAAACGLWAPARSPAAPEAPPRVVQGTIDLRGWDFDRDGPVSLDGEWDFYWHRFLEAGGEAPGVAREPAPARIPVPAAWNGRRIGGRTIDGRGHASYRLTVLLDSEERSLALHVVDAATACRVYVGGREVYQAGAPAASRGHSRAGFRPAVVELPPLAGETELLVHVANFAHRQGGLWERIKLGTPSQLHALRERRIAFDMALFGSLLLMGLYHLGRYGMRRTDAACLFFGLGCLSVMLRPLTTGERYLVQLFDALPFELLGKLEYWGFYLTVAFLALFTGNFFRQEADRRIILAVTSVAAIFSLLVLITPLYVYSFTMPVFQVFTLAALGYGLLVAGRALGRPHSGADVFLLGFLALCATIVNDILYSREVIQSAYVAPFGLMVFILAQSFIISRRTADLLAVVESQQERLQASEEKYRLLVDSASDAIFIVQDGTVRFANPRTAALFGIGVDQLPGVRPESYVHLDDRRGVAARLAKGMAEGTGVAAETFRLVNRSGATVWVQLNAVPTRWEERPATLCFLRDVSARKQLENQLYRARKMEALGTLAGGIARHTLRFIGDVVRQTERVILKLSGENGHRRDLRAVIDRCGEMREIVEQVQAFSRKAPLELRPLSIAKEVEGAVEIVRVAAPDHVQVHADIGGRDVMVMANAAQMREVVLNLATNALEAMQETAGTLNLALREVLVAPGAPQTAAGLLPGCYVRLTVADTGSGIPVEIQERVFDPFFTTRPEGTGMGLATVLSIVKGHGGDIELVSTPRMGTTVHVFLPALSECTANRLFAR